MKKFLLLALSCLVLTFLFVLGFQYFMHLKSQKGALQVTSVPESKVYLNEKYIGTTPLCKCEAADMIQAGEYTVKLVPTKNNLAAFQEKITITEAVLTVVDRKFDKDSLSEGSVMTLTPLADKEKAELLIASLPEGATIFLDNTEIGRSPFSFKDPTISDHILKIKKEGYKEKTIRIRTPKGYKLTVAAYLSTLNDLLSSEKASSSAEFAITPTPSLQGQTILILDTPTGFLRVRDTVGGAEIGRVTPGEVYEFIDEQTGWVQIKLKDGTPGWISNQYTQKQ